MTEPTDRIVGQPAAPAVQASVENRREEFLEDLRTLVHAETPSQDKPLLDAGLEVIRRTVIERLGEPLQETRYDGGQFGDVLDQLWAGQDAEGQPVEDPSCAVLIICHYDTVWPAGTLDTWPLSIDGDRLTGPGVLDMKFGIVQAVWAVKSLRELDVPHPPARLLLTGDEEIGSTAGRPRIEAAAQESALTLVTEPSAGGNPKDQRKGMVFADLSVTGRQAHAGLEPQKGASAIHALASLIAGVVGLEAADRGTTVTVGTFHGGTRRNVVAGFAECLVDVRVTDPAEQDRVASALQELELSEPYRSDDRLVLRTVVDANRPPMNPTPASRLAMSQVLKVGQDLGRDLVPTAVGGASDANFVSALELPVVDGLGAVGEGPHAVHEHILLSGIGPQTGLLSGIIASQL